MEIHLKMGSDQKRKVDVQVTDQSSSLPSRLPLKLLVLAELAPREDHETSSLFGMGRVRVDKETFGTALQKFVGQISIDVPNCLGGGPKRWSIILPIDSIKGFHPDAIVQAVPPLRDFVEIRQRLVRLRNREISFEVFRTELAQLRGGGDILRRIQKALEIGRTESPAPAAPHSDSKRPAPSRENESALDSIFEIVAAPGAGHTSPESTSPLDHFISGLISSGRPGASVDFRAIESILSDLDQMLGAQVDAILHHPEFQRLEAVWRGVKFLIDRTDFREPIQIELLHAPKEQLAEIFERDVFQPESEESAESPVSIIVADYFFDRSRQDMELLHELAEKAERLQTPMVAAVGPAFFGMESVDQLKQVDALGNIFDQAEYVKWRSFRQGSSSRWLALLFNRFLLRLPYGPEQGRVKSFVFQEAIRADSSLLWGNPVWGLASLITASFARTGWAGEITGARGGLIEDLPLREIKGRGGEKGHIPLEALISEEHRIDLAESGIVALTGRINTDAIVMPFVPSVHRPERYPDPRETALSAARAAFPYQLVAGRLSQLVGLIAGGMGEGKSSVAIEKVFMERLTSSLSISSEAVEVQARESEEKPDRFDLLITFRPDRAGLALSAPVELSLSLRK